MRGQRDGEYADKAGGRVKQSPDDGSNTFAEEEGLVHAVFEELGVAEEHVEANHPADPQHRADDRIERDGDPVVRELPSAMPSEASAVGQGGSAVENSTPRLAQCRPRVMTLMRWSAALWLSHTTAM